MGAARLWRRECFEVAPYIPSYAPDSVSNIKANLAGWDTRMYGYIHGHQLRRMGTSQGMCRGAQMWGKSSHFLGSGPLFGLLKGVKLMTRYPYYTGICYLRGYFSSWMKRKERISDPAIIGFYAGRRLRDYLGRKKKVIRT